MSDISSKLKFAERLVARGKISRREFVQLALAAGFTVAAADAMFVKAARAEPKKGGHFKMAHGVGSTTDTLDPATYANQYTMVAIWGSADNGLTEVDAAGNAVGDLAGTVEPADEAKKWVFKLRRGVTFHNEKTVTSDDVVASYRHHMTDGSKSASKSLLKAIKDIKTDGPETVIFELDGGNADFPYITSDIPIMPSANGKVDWQSGVRTGAYVIEKFEPGVKTTLKKYPNYYRTDRGHFDSAEVLSIVDVAARTNALTSGEVDYINFLDLKTLPLLQRNQSIKILEVVGYGHYIFTMNVTVPPFDNVDVRTALKYSLDREEILKRVFRGHGKVGNDNPIAPSVKFAVDPEPKHVYDPEKAKSYLKKAGFETLKVDLSASEEAFANCVDTALLWKEHATKAGIDLNVIREPTEGYWNNVWLKKPFCGSYWVGRPTCDWMFTMAYAADLAWNETFWKNPRFNQLLIQGRSETDESKRARIYAEMQQLVHDDGGLVNPVFNSFVSAHNAKLGHEEVAPNLPDDGARLIERWWFEA